MKLGYSSWLNFNRENSTQTMLTLGFKWDPSSPKNPQASTASPLLCSFTVRLTPSKKSLILLPLLVFFSCLSNLVEAFSSPPLLCFFSQVVLLSASLRHVASQFLGSSCVESYAWSFSMKSFSSFFAPWSVVASFLMDAWWRLSLHLL